MNQVIMPIYIPRHIEPYRCPNCNEIENKKEICTYCKYEYPEDNESCWYLGWIPIIGAIIGTIWPPITNEYFGITFGDRILGFLWGSVGAVIGSLIILGVGYIVYKTFREIF